MPKKRFFSKYRKGRHPKEMSAEKKSKIVNALKRNHERTNKRIGEITGVRISTVRIIRKELEKAKQIQRFDGRKLVPKEKRVSPEKRKKLNEELLTNPERTDEEIAKIVGVSHNTVNTRRHRLEKAGKIKRFRAKPIPISYSTRRKIVKGLKKTPMASDRSLAKKAGASPPTISKIRKRLEKKGRIPVKERQKGGKKIPYSKAATIVRELKKNPEKGNLPIAKIAGVSDVTVGKIRKKLEEKGKIKRIKARIGRKGIPFSKAKIVVKELKKNPERTNKQIAKKAKVTAHPVRQIRLKLEKKGKIKKYRSPSFVKPSKHPKTKEIEAYLTKNPKAINTKIAKMFGCSNATVDNIRKQLEMKEKIPVTKRTGKKRKILISHKSPEFGVFLKRLAFEIKELEKRKTAKALNDSRGIEEEIKYRLKFLDRKTQMPERAELLSVYAELKEWQVKLSEKLPPEERKKVNK